MKSGNVRPALQLVKTSNISPFSSSLFLDEQMSSKRSVAVWNPSKVSPRLYPGDISDIRTHQNSFRGKQIGPAVSMDDTTNCVSEAYGSLV